MGEGRQRKKPDLLLMPVCIPCCSVLYAKCQFERENPQRRPRGDGNSGNRGICSYPHTECTEFEPLAWMTMEGMEGRVAGNKAAGAGGEERG